MQCLVAILAMENGKAARQRGLASLELKGVEVTEKEMSVGTFGQAVEVRYKGLRCVARKVTDRGKSEKRSGTDGVTAERLEEHCLLVSRLRHPHIVQFLGVYLERGSNLPVIVTEYLPTTLAKCLEGYGAFPGEVSYSVLRDVALGLAYLHGQSPPVVHGCLSPACVLLGWDMTAKIGDVGVARLQPESVSGRACGEAHDPKADLYCYGILMIHTLSGKPPTQISSSNTMTADKKSQYIHEYVEDHALSSLISQCINSSPQNRPEASQVLATVTEMMPQLSPSLLEPRLEILRSIHRGARGKRTSPQHSPRRTKSVSRRDKLVQSTELECLRLELDEMQIENRVLKNSIGKQKSVVSARDQEMAAKLMAKDQEIFSKQQELLAKEAALEGNAAMMEAKEATIQGLSKQLRHLQGCLKTRNEAIVWDIRHCRYSRRLEGHQGAVYAVDLDDSAATAFTGSGDKLIIQWEVATGERLRVIRASRTHPVIALHWQQGYLVSSAGIVVSLWSVQKGRAVLEFRGHEDRVESVQLKVHDIDKRTGRIISGGRDKTIKYWDIRSGRCLRTLRGHEGTVNCAWSDEVHIVSTSDDRSISIWDFHPHSTRQLT